jgi:hypothetical protein
MRLKSTKVYHRRPYLNFLAFANCRIFLIQIIKKIVSISGSSSNEITINKNVKHRIKNTDETYLSLTIGCEVEASCLQEALLELAKLLDSTLCTLQSSHDGQVIRRRVLLRKKLDTVSEGGKMDKKHVRQIDRLQTANESSSGTPHLHFRKH